MLFLFGRITAPPGPPDPALIPTRVDGTGGGSGGLGGPAGSNLGADDRAMFNQALSTLQERVAKVGPGRYCSPRHSHSVPSDYRKEGSSCGG